MIHDIRSDFAHHHSALASQSTGPKPTARQVSEAREVKQAFSDFVGETFFGHMLSAMRDTVGKPAYFHGGQAEETFRSQLDQQLATELSKSSGDRFAEPMFRQQFPQYAAVLDAAEPITTTNP